MPEHPPAQLNFAPLRRQLGFLPHRILGMGPWPGACSSPKPGADARRGQTVAEDIEVERACASDDILEIDR